MKSINKFQMVNECKYFLMKVSFVKYQVRFNWILISDFKRHLCKSISVGSLDILVVHVGKIWRIYKILRMSFIALPM